MLGTMLYPILKGEGLRAKFFTTLKWYCCLRRVTLGFLYHVQWQSEELRLLTVGLKKTLYSNTTIAQLLSSSHPLSQQKSSSEELSWKHLKTPPDSPTISKDKSKNKSLWHRKLVVIPSQVALNFFLMLSKESALMEPSWPVTTELSFLLTILNAMM